MSLFTAFTIIVLCSLVTATTANVTNGVTQNLLETMKRNIMLSYVSYCPKTHIEKWDCYWCRTSGAKLENVTVYENPKSHLLFYVGTLVDDLSFTTSRFRGTVDPFTDIRTMILDTDIRHTDNPFGPGKIELGYWKCYEYIKDEVIETVRDYLNVYGSAKFDRVIMSGHSLGSVLVDLALIDLIQNEPNIRDFRDGGNVTIMTFGSPRLGDEEFARFFTTHILAQEHVFRITNQRDIVPHWPPGLGGYAHFPREYWFKNSTSEYVACDSVDGEDPKCSDSVSLKSYSFLDHMDYIGVKLMKGALPPYWCADSLE